MRWRRQRLRTWLVAVALAAVALAGAFRWWRGSGEGFAFAASRAVPEGATLERLELIAGPARRPAPSDRLVDAMTRIVRDDPFGHPDGWREGDSWVFYPFEPGERYWFQVRDGRLVNYDPAALARLPGLMKQPLTGR